MAFQDKWEGILEMVTRIQWNRQGGKAVEGQW